jgi:hypothetical protein
MLPPLPSRKNVIRTHILIVALRVMRIRCS